MESPSPASAAGSVTSTAGPTLARPLTASEAAHLDRLRDRLRRDGTDPHDAAALDARWERLLGTHGPEVPAPVAVVAAVGIAVGDMLEATVADAVWAMCPGPDGATPGVLVLDRPHMPVLPVLDAHARWRVRSPGWTVDYVERAAAYLRQGPAVLPTPHRSPDDALVEVPSVAEEVVEPAVTVEPAVVVEPAVTVEAAVAVGTDPAPEPVAAVAAPRALTPEDLPHRPSERVQDLALRALEVALDRAVADPAGCAPFVLVREDHAVEVLDFPHTDTGLAQARDAARAGRYTAAAVAWTGPADASHAHPRVVVDASAAGRPGLRVAHAFTHDEDGGREIGGPQVVGQSAPVL